MTVLGKVIIILQMVVSFILLVGDHHGMVCDHIIGTLTLRMMVGSPPRVGG